MTDIEDLIRSIVRDELAKSRPVNDAPEQLSVTAYAQRWSISESTVRLAIRERRLEHARIGKAIRIVASAEIAPARVDDIAAAARRSLLRGRVR